MINVLLIHPSDTYEATTVTVERIDGSLESFQSLVGGYIEEVPVNLAGCSAYVNEEGRQQRLPANVLASHICPLATTDPVVGPMVIFGRGDPERSVPDSVVDDLEFIVTGPHALLASAE